MAPQFGYPNGVREAPTLLFKPRFRFFHHPIQSKHLHIPVSGGLRHRFAPSLKALRLSSSPGVHLPGPRDLSDD
jgi:hypothetical protein